VIRIAKKLCHGRNHAFYVYGKGIGDPRHGGKNLIMVTASDNCREVFKMSCYGSYFISSCHIDR
jgi:hypothetical protein